MSNPLLVAKKWVDVMTSVTNGRIRQLTLSFSNTVLQDLFRFSLHSFCIRINTQENPASKASTSKDR